MPYFEDAKKASESMGAEALVNESKHTPGPWTINTVNPHCLQIRAKKGTTEFECSTAIIGGWDTTAAENEANARLIAAAPELLRVAEWLVTADADCEKEQSWNWDDLSGTIKAARAAIAKAKSE